ncbi:MAG: NRAMP family divalent metal transporter [Ktedonobacteraceae bacterium]
MTDKQSSDRDNIEPGMTVEATEGDLGEQDVSKPKVTDVVQDAQGNVEKIVVSKGVVFKKKIDIPADRIQSVQNEQTSEGEDGTAIIVADEAEMRALAAVGEEELPPENELDRGFLDTVEREIPTAEGLREYETVGSLKQVRRSRAPSRMEHPKQPGDDQEEVEGQVTPPEKKNFWLHVLGPGFLGGMAGNDASAVTSYSVDGATNGYGHLWLLLLATPLYQSVQFACAKMGRITQLGFAEILREHYGRGVAIPASLILIVANVALMAADLVAIGSGFELITGITWYWFVLPIAIILWYLTVYRNFETIKKIFIVMSLAFVTYIITALLSGANWQSVLVSTFVPHINFGFASISSAVALLGATISPYTMFWQVQGEKEEVRAGTTKQKVKGAEVDVAIGVISGNLVSFFIIVCTSATLFAHHQSITTAADAARSLEPLLGPFAKYLFAIGFIGAGLVAIPVLLASTSYAVSGIFGWPAGLSKKPWQSEGFYLILTASMLVSLIIALLRFDPIQLMFWANVLNGVLAPMLVIYLIVVGNNRKIMRNQPMSWLTNTGMVITAILMFAAAILLFYGLATGQSG